MEDTQWYSHYLQDHLVMCFLDKQEVPDPSEYPGGDGSAPEAV